MKATLTAKPKRKPNLVRWFTKHNISSNHCSQGQAVKLAIEHLEKLDRW